jgi:L-rhamnose mutarotase
MKRICQVLDLKEDQQLIEEYDYWHRAENIWPEIPKGIREVGIENMEIYRLNSKLVMILEVPDDFDFEKSFAELAKKEKQAEWEDFVGKYQKCSQGSSSSQKWQIMDKIFDLKSNKSYNTWS